MNVLIADDDSTNLKLLAAMLEAESHEVFQALDGVDALAVLESNRIDAVISDILMPRMDGYRLCLEIRKQPRFQRLPFIIYTSTYTSPGDEQAALDFGADLFLKKPAPALDIAEALRSLTKARPRSRRLISATSTVELDLMKEYSERLVVKLEQKNAELEAQTVQLRRSEANLKQTSENLRELAARMHATREEERMRIAREMHDGLGGMLTGIELSLTTLENILERDGQIQRAKAIERLQALRSMTRDTTQMVRKLCTELRPSILDDLGLVPALEWQLKEFAERSGTRCQARFEMTTFTPSADQATTVFRIFQEMLTNVSRHAGAALLKVRLQETEHALRLEVQDNGRGFQAEELARTRHLGVLGMKERALLHGGTVELASQPGKGTRVTLTLPLARPGVK